jgi:NAD(P)-dependent dehydrogenase (short-subunit alcohol dehydrogenase family)
VDDCTGKVVLITGAASGCGQAIARDFAARGAKVLVNDIDAERGAATAAAIEKGGGTTAFIHADVSKEDEVARLVDGTVDRFGALNCAVNNAGTEFAVAIDASDATASRRCWRRTSKACGPASSTRSGPCDAQAAARS